MAKDKKENQFVGETVKPKDYVEIVYTDTSSYHDAGDTEKVHRLLADKLVKKGVAKLK